MANLISKLMHVPNVMEKRGEKVVFPNAIVATHSALPGEPDNLGIWWYHLPTKKLLFSTSAWAHIDKEFVEQIPELALTRVVPNKVLANKAGWISGRAGKHENFVFVFLYANELNGRLPGVIAVDIISQLEKASGLSVDHLTDEDGYALTEPKTQTLKNVMADSHSDEYKIAVWWYGVRNGKFELSLTAKSHEDRDKLEQTDRDDPDWGRGRVFESSENGRFYISVYKNSFETEPLTGHLLDLIYKKIQDAMPGNIKIAGIVDENGCDLLAPKGLPAQ